MLVTRLYFAKKDEPIEMPLGAEYMLVQGRNHMLDGIQLVSKCLFQTGGHENE